MKVLITAGPTYEKIDPVRYIGNFSSGKMGFCLAEVALSLGFDTTLITGPTSLYVDGNVKRYDVVSANEMFEKVKLIYSESNIVIMSAAVSDYKPKIYSENKIKKGEDNFSLELEKNIDILKYLGDNKGKQFLVGFALETNNEKNNAMEKLYKKNLDLIVLNSLKDQNSGFGFDTNKINIFDKSGLIFSSENKHKKDIAMDIFQLINDKI